LNFRALVKNDRFPPAKLTWDLDDFFGRFTFFPAPSPRETDPGEHFFIRNITEYSWNISLLPEPLEKLLKIREFWHSGQATRDPDSRIFKHFGIPPE
jgi:hypothetical protein